jgi:hypothetical protein
MHYGFASAPPSGLLILPLSSQSYAAILVLPPLRHLVRRRRRTPASSRRERPLHWVVHRRNSNAQLLFSAYYGTATLQTHKKEKVLSFVSHSIQSQFLLYSSFLSSFLVKQFPSTTSYSLSSSCITRWPYFVQPCSSSPLVHLLSLCHISVSHQNQHIPNSRTNAPLRSGTSNSALAQQKQTTSNSTNLKTTPTTSRLILRLYVLLRRAIVTPRSQQHKCSLLKVC